MPLSKIGNQAQDARLQLIRLRRELGRQPDRTGEIAKAVSVELADQLERDLNVRASR